MISSVCINPQNAAELSKQYDKIYLVVPADIKGANIIFLPELAPSPKLYEETKTAKKQGCFNSCYYEHYMLSVINYRKNPDDGGILWHDTAHKALTKIYLEGRYKNIAVADCEKHEKYSHRSIIIGMLQGKDRHQTVPIVQCDSDHCLVYDRFVLSLHSNRQYSLKHGDIRHFERLYSINDVHSALVSMRNR